MLYNGETKYFHNERGYTNVVISSNGTVIWIPNTKVTSPCEADTTNFPFDTAECHFTFGPWTHSVSTMELTTNGSGFMLDDYTESSTWSVTGTSSFISRKKYACCEDKFATVTFILSLRRKPDFLLKVLLLPIILLPLLAAGTFWIPAERPDRIGVGVALFGAFFLLLLLNADYTPPEASSNLATLCGLNMTLIAVSIIASIASVDLNRKKSPVPRCTENVFLGGLGRVLGVVPATGSTWTGEDSPKRDEDVAAKWKAVSVVLDRIMFVVYLIGIIIGFVILFPRPSS